MQHLMGPLICSVSIFNFCINTQFLGVLFKLVGMKLRASGNPQDPLLLAAAAPTPILYCLLRALLPVIRDFICIPYCVLQIVVNCNVSFFIQIYVFFSHKFPCPYLRQQQGNTTVISIRQIPFLRDQAFLHSPSLQLFQERQEVFWRFSEAVFKLLLGNLYPFWQWTNFFPSKATYIRRKRSITQLANVRAGCECSNVVHMVTLLYDSLKQYNRLINVTLILNDESQDHISQTFISTQQLIQCLTCDGCVSD